jgi:hypothetical protein
LTPASWKFFHLSEASSPEISQIAHPHEYSQLHFHAHILSERVGYTRGQIIDMAFLGGGWPKPDGSVALSSTDSDVVCHFYPLFRAEQLLTTHPFVLVVVL